MMEDRDSNSLARAGAADSPPASASLRQRSAGIGIAVLLLACVLWVFSPALSNGFLEYDDALYVTANPQVRSGLTWAGVVWAFGNPVAANWHPLTVLSHMLDCQLYGLKAWGHHLTSVLLHAFNAVLLFAVFRRMTGALWRPAALALLFGLHPLRVESVAWIAERKDVLSTMFWMLTLLLYVRYLQQSKVQSPKSKVSYAAALVCFLCGLMSKPMLVTLPFVLLLLDYWPLGRTAECGVRSAERGPEDTSLGRSFPWVKLAGEKLPFLGLAAIFSVVTYLAQRSVGALVTDWALEARLANSLVAYVRYLGKFCWPANLSAFYPHPGQWPAWQVLAAAGVLLAVLAMVVLLRRKRPYLAVGWLWFCGTLIPVIGLVQVGRQSMADRYTYIPLIGLLIMVIWGGYDAARRWRHGAWVAALLAAAAIFACGVLTRRELGYWKDDETLWSRALAVTRNNSFAHYNLGVVLAAKGAMPEGVAEFERALRLDPRDHQAHVNLGSILARAGRLEEAIGHFEEALRLYPKPAEVHYNLGLALLDRARYAEAAARFGEVLRREPNLPGARQKLEQAIAAQRAVEQATAPYREALRNNPRDTRSRSRLGQALLEAGQVDEAVAEFAEAARLEPRNAPVQYQMGAALARKGEPEQAARQFELALELDPTLAAAHYALGIIRKQQRRMAEALQHWREAARLAPQWPDPLNNLAWALATDPQPEVRDGEEAAKRAERALALAGTNNVAVLDTLAAAYAEAGRFAEAVATARQAQAAAVAQGQAGLGEQIGQRLALYRNHQPYRRNAHEK